MSKRLDQEREIELTPQRIRYAYDALFSLVRITLVDEVKIRFIHENEECTLYPYSGWHTGKSIKDGRGLNNLLKQLK